MNTVAHRARAPYHKVCLLLKRKMLQDKRKQLLLFLAQMLLQRNVNLLNLAYQLPHDRFFLRNVSIDRSFKQMLQVVEQQILHQAA